MSSEKSIIISKENKIIKFINAIKVFLFGKKIIKKDIQNSIDKLKLENEHLKDHKEDDNLVQAIVATNEKRIAALNYMKDLKKSRNKKEIIIVE